MNLRDDSSPAKLESKSTRNRIILGLIIILVVLGGLIIFYFMNKPSPPPAQILNLAEAVNFKVYYPSKLPGGYSYTDGSANIQSGFLYYKLHSGTKVISVTEQPIPASTVNLQNLPKYSSLSVPAGPAAIGLSVGNPSVVIVTGSTLVNMNSSKGVAKDTLVFLAKNIKSVQTQNSD